MKYTFVFDKDFKKGCFMELSDEELRVVIASVIGGHNTLFYGYKPERLVKAFKYLSSKSDVHIEEPSSDVTIDDFYGGGADLHKGIVTKADKGVLIMNNINKFKGSIISLSWMAMEQKQITLARAGRSTVFPCDFQMVATVECDTHKDIKSIENWELVSSLAKRCDIVYECTPYPSVNLYATSPINMYYDYLEKYSRYCEPRGNGSAPATAFHLSSLSMEKYGTVEDKTKRLARTLGAMQGHQNIWAYDIYEALSYNNYKE